MESGKLEVGSEKCRVNDYNEKCEVESGKRKAKHAKWEMGNEKRKVESEKCRVMSGKWEAESAEGSEKCRVESGKCAGSGAARREWCRAPGVVPRTGSGAACEDKSRF